MPTPRPLHALHENISRPDFPALSRVSSVSLPLVENNRRGLTGLHACSNLHWKLTSLIVRAASTIDAIFEAIRVAMNRQRAKCE